MNAFQYKHGDRPLEGYTIQRAVGRGGFGEVYFALSDSGREVALKAIQGYEQIELRGVGQCMNLKSPHLVSIFDVRHNDEGKPFVIMEYVSGPSLKDLLDQSPSGLGVQKAAFFLREIAKGLTFLHDRGIVHRDLKPANIFYEEGYVKIGDYGLSKAMTASRHSNQTITVGTVHYMAPEIGHGRYDRSIDIYALGILLYEMLTGQVPFFGASHGEVLMKHLMAEPDLAGIEEPFAGVIRKAMAKEPADRYQSVQEMVEAIFGAEHVRNSVSHFSPDSLTMVAGRVAQKVAVGGPGSSADACGTGFQPVTPPDENRYGKSSAAGGWGGPGQWGTEFGERMGRWGEEFGDRMARWSERFGRQMTGGWPGQPQQHELEDDPSVTVFADPRRDPLDRRQRRMLCLATIVLVGAGAGLLGARSFAPLPGSLLFGVSTIFGATWGITLARHRFGAWMQQESGMFPRLVYGGFGSLLALPVLVLSSAMSGGALGVTGTAAAVLLSLFLVDWKNRTAPGRKERVELDNAFTAGLLGWVVAMMIGSGLFQGHGGGATSALMAGGILAGISLASQVLAPFDPLAVRKPKKKDKAKAAPASSDGQGPADHLHAQTAQGAPDWASGPDGHWSGSGHPVRQAGNAGTHGHAPRLVPPWVRALCLLGFAFLLGTGVLLLAWAGMMGSREWSVIGATVVSSGIGSLLFALFLLVKAIRTTMRSWWSGLVRPLLMLACLQSGLTAAIVLGNRHLGSEETVIALAFIIFPAIALIILMFISDRMVGTPATAAAGMLHDAQQRYQQFRMHAAASAPPYVSPRYRMYALLLACVGFAGFAGFHRFYVGKIGTGVLWLVTGGVFGIGTIVDLALVALGRFRDKEGRLLVLWEADGGRASQPGGRDARFPGVAPAATGPPPTPGMGPASPIPPEREPAPADAVLRAALGSRWVAQESRVRTDTSPTARGPRFLAAFAVLMLIPGLLLGVALAVDVPAMVAAGLPDPSLAQELQNAFGYTDWPRLVRRVGVFLFATWLAFGGFLLVLARRHTGAGHVSRAVLGMVSLFLAINLLQTAFGVVKWPWITSMFVDANQPAQALDMLIDSVLLRPLIAAGVMLCGGILLLCWPPKRLDAAAGQLEGGGA